MNKWNKWKNVLKSNTQKKDFSSSQREANPWPPRYRLERSNRWALGNSWWAALGPILQPSSKMLGRFLISLYPSPLFNVEVYQETSITPYCLSRMFTNTSTLIWGRGAHKHSVCTYRLDLFKCCWNQGVHFRPSQLFLSGVVGSYVTHLMVYDLPHHESPTAQLLERPTGIWKVMGSTPVGKIQNSFSEYSTLALFFIYHTKKYCFGVWKWWENTISCILYITNWHGFSIL